MYEVILLDADGTLFDFDQAEHYAFAQTISQQPILAVNEDVFEAYQSINKALWVELEKGKITTEQIKTERFRRLLKDRASEVDIQEISQLYIEKLSEGNFLLEGALELCQYLYEKYRLVIITNGINEVQKSRLARSDIKAYIEWMTISGEAGFSKPDPRIFEYTLEKIGYVKPHKCLMVGDSLTSDIQGGINFGVDTCWVNLDNNVNNTLLKPTYEINHLSQLKDIL